MKNLFEATTLKNIKIKNRFFRGATWEGLADENGHLTPELIEIYKELAEGGVGCIITGYANVRKDEKPVPGMMGAYDDSFIDEYKNFTNLIHGYDTKIILQLAYGGSMTNYNVGERVIWGPSTMINEVTKTSAIEISKSEIKELTEDFAAAALRAKKAGFDGVQIHSAHGYLYSLFLSPLCNKREDEYGGSIENRARIIFETYKKMREAVGDDFIISIKLQSADYAENGLTEEDSLWVATELSKLGIDLIEVSGGNSSLKEVIKNNLPTARTKIFGSKEKESYFSNYAKKLSSLVDTPVLVIGGNRSYDVLDNILNESNISYFSMARPLIREPNLINRWKSGDLETAKCVSCNACFGTEGKRCIFNIKK